MVLVLDSQHKGSNGPSHQESGNRSRNKEAAGVTASDLTLLITRQQGHHARKN